MMKYLSPVRALQEVEMINPELTTAVEKFAASMADMPDEKLDTAWLWKGHDEGVRFAYFVTLLELRQLAVKLASDRSMGVKLPPRNSAQRILAQYHSAFMDLQATLLGVSAKNALVPPEKKEWPIRTIYSHILSAELNFSAVIRFALENHRSGKWLPNPIPAKEYQRLIGMKQKEYNTLLEASLSKLVSFHRKIHPSMLREFAVITNDELALPAAYWEETRFHIGYRLHRFEAHLRQHTIQIDKTLIAIGIFPSEANRLNRMLFSALAEINGFLIVQEDKKNQESIELARTIEARVKELNKILV
jgi:hypothetical protein